MNTIQHVPFAQFAEDFAAFMDRVRAQQTPIVVDFAGGEQLLITPYPPAGPAQAARTDAAPAPDDRPQPPPSQDQPSQDPELDTDNISSVGAMYDIDPNSVTPG